MEATDPTLTLDEAAEHRRRALALTALAAVLARRGITFDDYPADATLQPTPASKPRPAWLRGVVDGGRTG